MHEPLADQHQWYASVLRGHYAYYGLPHNYRALAGFQQEVRRIWSGCLTPTEPTLPTRRLGLV